MFDVIAIPMGANLFMITLRSKIMELQSYFLL